MTAAPPRHPPGSGAGAVATRRVERVRFEPRRRALTVARVERPTPGFARVTLAGPELEGFRSLSFDDHLKLFVPLPDGSLAMRDITPRAFDPSGPTLQLELALHGHGPASGWAARVQPGDAVTVAGPRGSMIVAADHDWHLLAGDASALPAIARRLEELPAGVFARVLVHVDDAADERPLASAARLSVTWVRTAAQWLEALRAESLPDGEGFAWLAAEARVVAQARAILVDAHGHPREAMRAAAYWKQGATGFHETLDA